MATLIKIAKALNILTDEILYNYVHRAKNIALKFIYEELSDCDECELIIEESIKAIKRLLKKQYNKVGQVDYIINSPHYAAGTVKNPS